MNQIALRQKMIEKDKLHKDLAFELGISKSSLHRKLTGETEFTQGEMRTLVKVLDLSEEEAYSIFFEEKVS